MWIFVIVAAGASPSCPSVKAAFIFLSIWQNCCWAGLGWQQRPAWWRIDNNYLTAGTAPLHRRFCLGRWGNQSDILFSEIQVGANNFVLALSILSLIYFWAAPTPTIGGHLFLLQNRLWLGHRLDKMLRRYVILQHLAIGNSSLCMPIIQEC